MATKKPYGKAKPKPLGMGIPPAGSPGPVQQAPPVQPHVQTPPPDPYLIGAQTEASRNVLLGDAQGAYQRAQIETDVGLNPAYASNPFSQAKLLEDTYKRNQRATLNSAGKGLYSGAYGRAQAEDTRQYDLGYYNLSRDYNRALQDVDWGQAQNYVNNSMSVDDESWRALMRRLTGKG